nr:retrovirus-related Pol polyprotein from transposon TNT 1-94 [Tanacetum cinerariifolium]
LTSSRPDIVHATCLCARYQAKPTEKHLKEVKRIFCYLRGTINTGLWYTKDSGFELTRFSDADYAGCKDTYKSTSGGAQFLGEKLVSWSSKKQDCTTLSTAEAEYVSLSACSIAISCNPVQHSRTKYITVRYHFIKEHVEKGTIELYFVKTDYQLAGIFTKALPTDRFNYLVRRLVKMSRDVLTVGSTMRIPLLYRGEYSQWVERFMNCLEEQTDGEAMINSIKNSDQPLPRVTQVSIAGTTSTEQPPLKDKSIWSAQEKRVQKIDLKTAKDLWDALARHMLGFEYGEQDRKAAVLYEYQTFKATEGELLLDTYIRYLQVINDLKKCGYSKDNCELNFKFLNNLQLEWKQYATMMRNPVKEVLLKLNLPGHRISRWRYNLTPAESKFKTPMLDHQDKYKMKAQVHVLKSSAIFDEQPLPQRKYHVEKFYESGGGVQQPQGGGRGEKILNIGCFSLDNMSRDILTIGSTMRISLLYRGEYSQWFERFMNYLEEQTDEEAMINSIKNGDQPLPRVTQVSIVETSSTEQPPLKDKSMCNYTAKDLWDALARHMLGSEYSEQDRKAAIFGNLSSLAVGKSSGSGNSSLAIVQICLWIIDSGFSKHMTGNRALLTNFVEKFLGTVRFGNNDFAVITGYGDVVIGSMTIKKVYYVEGLGHNLFSFGQFCDKGLEVAFQKSTYFVRNEEGVDLLTGDRSSNLYTIALNEVASNSSTCLLAKASSLQSWLWHQRLSHLNFVTINNLVKNNLVQGLPKMKFEKDHLCFACEQGKIHQKHHKSKTDFASNKQLYLLYMDLCGPMRVESINEKQYVLVVVDYYS